MTESQPEASPQAASPAAPIPAPRGGSALRPVWVIFLIFAAVFTFTALSNWRTPAERVKWRSDLDAARSESASSRKPVLLYFTASWCGPCQSMRRNVWSRQDVADATERFVPVRVDIDADPALARRYRVEAIPLIAVLDDGGNVARSVNRGMRPNEVIAWLEQPPAR